MPKEPTATEWLLADLEEQIQAAQAAGDRPREAIAHLQIALVWLSETDWEQADQALARAADLAARDGRPDLVSQAQAAQALLRDRHPAAATDLPEFDPDTPASWPAWGEQMTARLQQQLEALLQNLASEQPDQQAQLQAHRAKLAWLAGEPAQVQASLQAATTAAQASGNPELIAQIEALQRTLLSQQAAAASPDPFSALLAQTMQTGDLPIAGDRVLQRALLALQQKDYQQVLTLAEQARQQALTARDLTHYLRYLFACIFIAFARDGLGDRPGVIAILLTCKVTLEGEGQAVFGRQLVELLDGLEVRWGNEAFQAARRAYRQQMQGPEP